ncbi:MAG: DUF3887 domain-containing protein [Prochloraceae cyanobacterium]|nr:DUF3887 domain-containing protein [Prochloraceae cyanobacterium]
MKSANLSPLCWRNYGKVWLYSLMLFTVSLSAVRSLAYTKQPQPVLISTEIVQLKDANSQKIQQKAENFVDLLAAEKFDRVRNELNSDLKRNWPASKIKQIWEELLAETGPFVRRGKSRVVKTVNGDLVFVSVEFKNTTDQLLVTFDRDRQIVGLDFPKIETIEEISEKVVNALAARDFARARGYLHPFLKQEIFPEQVQQKWQQLLLQTGAFERQVKTEVRQSSSTENMDIVLVTIEFEKVTDNLIVIFDRDKKIIGIDFPVLN